MTKAGDIIENPVTGERIVFVETAADTAGERLKIDLYLAEKGGELERAEADGNVVSRQEQRRAYGTHLTYLAKEGEYTMVGAPVKVYKDTAPDCSLTEGAVAKFSSAANTKDGENRASTSTVSGSDAFPHKSGKVACGSGPGSH